MYCNSSGMDNGSTRGCSNDTDPGHEGAKDGFQLTASTVVLAIVLSLVVLMTLLGNLLVIFAFRVDVKLRQPFNFYILNLAVTDCLVALAMGFYSIDTLLGFWPLGRAMCGFWIYLDFAMTFASVFTMLAISIDRYWCVTWAVHYKIHNSTKKVLGVIGLVWLSVFALWTPPFISDIQKHPKGSVCIWDPAENREFVILVAVIGHYIPCLLMIACYIKVFYVMRRQAKRVAANVAPPPSSTGVHDSPTCSRRTCTSVDGPCTFPSQSREPGPSSVIPEDGTSQTNDVTVMKCAMSPKRVPFVGRGAKHQLGKRDNPANASSNARERRTFLTLSYVLLCYLVCWFPFYVAFDTVAWQPDLVPPSLYTFVFWTSYANSTMNPFIYAFTSKDFRRAFMKVIRLMRCQSQ